MRQLFLLSAFLLLCSGLQAQKKVSTLHCGEDIFRFEGQRVYLNRDLPLNRYPIVDLSAPIPPGLHPEDLCEFEDTNRMSSTRASLFLSKGLFYEGGTPIKVTVKKTYLVLAKNGSLIESSRRISGFQQLEPAFSKDGVVQFESLKKFKPPKKEVKPLLEELLAEMESDMSLSEFVGRYGEDPKTGPSWTIQTDRIFIEVVYLYPDQPAEEEEYPLIMEMTQIQR